MRKMSKFSLDTQLARYLLDTTAQNLSPKTQGRVKLGLKLFAEFLGGVEDVRQVTDADLQRFIVALRQRTLWQGRQQASNKPLSDETIKTYVKSVREFWHWLHLKQVIKKDPMAAIRLPRVGKKLPRTFSETECLAIMAAVADRPREQALVWLLLDSGPRIAEITGSDRSPGLFIQDIDLKTGDIRVLGKGGRERQIHVSPETLQAIRLYIEHERPDPIGDDRLFLNQNGTSMSDSGGQRLLAAIGNRAGLSKRLSPHKLRHSFATLFLKNGGNTEYLRRFLGHRYLSTVQGYTDVADGDLVNAHRTFSPIHNLLQRRGKQGVKPSYQEKELVATHENQPERISWESVKKIALYDREPPPRKIITLERDQHGRLRQSVEEIVVD